MARQYLQDSGLLKGNVDLLVLSPGPSTPDDFLMKETIGLALKQELPIFGVCLGLQGIVEYFGGSLTELSYPMHGKCSTIQHDGSELFAGIDEKFAAGRYHSLIAKTVPECLEVTARTDDGYVMAVEHKSLPIKAVQFHPESIMTLQNQAGHRLVLNVVNNLIARRVVTENLKN